ncbi:ferritin-like domain-containing protein [Mucilaginibacter conchicola]|uniref:Ferritin-like domain-containing protein n=1 Tax=Mucilaginibacter conchicola TaxID=2303333 RepID=A0A372NZN2_9SPHI|nr:ferritin-like domain-containing protein [Mucilaginibacter conchicola]RFZ95576.1 ferritin-like domain-containing protein [Mucilaginibacter conchicola]
MKTDINPITGNVNMARRSFLRYAGAGVATAAVVGVTACHKDRVIVNPGGTSDIGSDDIGILNYAYALEQLEAAFYTEVVAHAYTGISTVELNYMTDIRDHEVVHREFFKAALKSNAIMSLTPDFSKIDFSNRTSVLATAKAFEDLGVQAYDGAGFLIKTPEYLTIAGKIVSVEARHAALIANLISPGSFVPDDQVDGNGLNKSATIAQVLPIANTFLKTKVTAKAFNYNG